MPFPGFGKLPSFRTAFKHPPARPCRCAFDEQWTCCSGGNLALDVSENSIQAVESMLADIHDNAQRMVGGEWTLEHPAMHQAALTLLIDKGGTEIHLLPDAKIHKRVTHGPPGSV
jgi:hypothetical protein